jgi:hypothetical protein
MLLYDPEAMAILFDLPGFGLRQFKLCHINYLKPSTKWEPIKSHPYAGVFQRPAGTHAEVVLVKTAVN